MVNYSEAFGKPFKDITTLVVGIVLMIIPLLNILTIPGYAIRVINRTVQKDDSMPKITENFGRLIIDSLKTIVIGIVYMIPATIVAGALFIVLGGGAALTALALSMISGSVAGASLLGAIGLAGAVAVIVLLAFMLLLNSAIIEFAKSGRLGSAFSFGKVVSSALRGGFIITYIITLIITGVAAMIPIVNIILVFPVYVITTTLLAQAHEGL